MPQLMQTLTYPGFHKHSGRRGLVHGVKDTDRSSILSEGKPLKRGGSSAHGSHEVFLVNLRYQVFLFAIF